MIRKRILSGLLAAIVLISLTPAALAYAPAEKAAADKLFEQGLWWATRTET